MHASRFYILRFGWIEFESFRGASHFSWVLFAEMLNYYVLSKPGG